MRVLILQSMPFLLTHRQRFADNYSVPQSSRKNRKVCTPHTHLTTVTTIFADLYRPDNSQHRAMSTAAADCRSVGLYERTHYALLKYTIQIYSNGKKLQLTASLRSAICRQV